MTEQKDVSFNLVDEPWIRVLALSGETMELSLSEVFARAHTLATLANDIPTQDFAILRLLLAVLQRSVLPMTEGYEYPSELWKELWESKTLPLDEIDAYLEKWHARFDLFDGEAPFMQVAGMEATNGSVSEIKKLVAEIPDGKPLFSLWSGNGLAALSFPEAARWLVHVHAFDTAGIKTGVIGDPAVKGGKSYPIGTGWAGRLGGVYLEGETLMRTLLLNLVLCDDASGDDYDNFFNEEDLPVWELSPQKPGSSDRLPKGVADLYTWQSRRVRLTKSGDMAVGVILSNGDKIDTYNQFSIEPSSPWHRSQKQEKKLGLPFVFLPTTHKGNRALWRGLTSVLPEGTGSEDRLAPGIIGWVGHLIDLGSDEGSALSEGYPLRIHATGVEYGLQSSVITELIDDFVLVNAFLISPQREQARYVVRDCMSQTEEAIRKLGDLARKLSLASGDDTERIGNAQVSATAEAYFELDETFRLWLSNLDAQSDLLAEKRRWYEQARAILGNMGSRLVEAAGPDAVVGRKVSFGGKEKWISAGAAESQYRYWLRRLLQPDEEQSKTNGEEGMTNG